MNGDAPEFAEATRLALKFFPESRGFISQDTGLDWDAFLGAMKVADYRADHSCYPFHDPSDPDLGLASKGGLDGDCRDVYIRLLQHTSMTPSGRTIVAPDAISRLERSTEDCPPFVCHAPSVPDRLKDLTCFGSARDTIFIFESGGAILIDHDERVHWAHSRIRQWTGKGKAKNAT